MSPESAAALADALAHAVDAPVVEALPWAAGRPLATLSADEQAQLMLATLRAIHRARSVLDEQAAVVVRRARHANASWRQIGACVGIGDEGARKRWARRVSVR